MSMINFYSTFKSNSKRIFFLIAMSIFFATSCSKQTASADVTARVRSVINSLSIRAQSAINVNDRNMNEFLADLKNVLAADEKAIAGGDISLLYLTDKKHYLPDGYAPRDIVPLTKGGDYNINRNSLSLRREAYDALVKMARAARADGVTLLASSTYRSYEYQITVYNKWVALEGQEAADRESARPGTSQHQLGTVIDFGSIDNTFAETRAGKWMAANSEKFGWSLSFPDGYEDVTGYIWESWHFRYIGVEACNFQRKYFSDIQQFMLEFINAWRKQ